MKKINLNLHERLATLLLSMGYELIGCEWVTESGQRIFRVYMDCEGGVTVDDCSKVSHQISALFDVEDPIEGRYSLEISSPGINRPLFDIIHYQKYIGRQIKLRLQMPLNGRRQFKGVLQRVEDETIHLLVQIESSEEEVGLPFSLIEKANLIGDL